MAFTEEQFEELNESFVGGKNALVLAATLLGQAQQQNETLILLNKGILRGQKAGTHHFLRGFASLGSTIKLSSRRIVLTGQFAVKIQRRTNQLLTTLNTLVSGIKSGLPQPSKAPTMDKFESFLRYGTPVEPSIPTPDFKREGFSYPYGTPGMPGALSPRSKLSQGGEPFGAEVFPKGYTGNLPLDQQPWAAGVFPPPVPPPSWGAGIYAPGEKGPWHPQSPTPPPPPPPIPDIPGGAGGMDPVNMKRGMEGLSQGIGRQLKKQAGPLLILREVLASVKRLESLQTESLARGFSVQKVAEVYAQTTKSLDSKLTGYSNALEITGDQLGAGFRKNSYETNRLGAYTKVTGGNTKALFKQLAKNTQGLGVTTADLATLSHSTIALSQKYGLTTSELVGAIGKLSNELATLGALGLAVDFQEAGMRLGAALGPTMAEMGPEMLMNLTKGGSMIQAQLLGVTKQREAILNKEGDMTRNAFDMVLTAADNAEKITQQWTQGAKDPAFMMLQATKIYGKEVAQLIQIKARMQELADAQNLSIEKYIAGVIKQNEISNEFRATWSNFKERFLSPFQKLFTFFGKIAFKIMNMPWVAELTSVIVGIGSILLIGSKLQALNNSRLAKNVRATWTSTQATLANTRALIATSAGKVFKGGTAVPIPKKGTPVPIPGGAVKGAKTGLWARLGGSLRGLTSRIAPMVRSLGLLARGIPYLGWIITAIMLLLPGIIKGFKEVWAWGMKSFKPIWDWLSRAWTGLKKQFGGLGKNFKWLGSIFTTIGKIIGYIIGGLLIGAIMIIAAPLWLLMKGIQGLMFVINWLGNHIQTAFDAVADAIDNSWFGSGGDDDDEGKPDSGTSYSAGAPVLQVADATAPVNVQQLRQEAAQTERTSFIVARDQEALDAAERARRNLQALQEQNLEELRIANEQRETALQLAADAAVPSSSARPSNLNGGANPG